MRSIGAVMVLALALCGATEVRADAVREVAVDPPEAPVFALGERSRMAVTAFRYLVDDDHALDLPAALAGDWGYRDGGIPNFGYVDAAVWLAFRIEGGGPARPVMEVAYPNLDELDVWVLDGRRVLAHHRSGDRLPFADRPVLHRHFVFPLAGPGTVVLRVRSTTSLQVPIVLWDGEAQVAAAQTSALEHGLFFGIMLVMAVYNLFIFVSIRERAYLYYVGFVLSFAAYQGIHHGFAYQYLWPEATWWHGRSGAVAISVCLGFAAIFTDTFLELRRRAPRLSTYLRSIAVMAAVLALASSFLRYSTAARIAAVLALLECGLVFAAGGAMWRRGIRSARYFTIAWAAFLIGATLFALSKLGLVPHNAVTENALQLGSVVEVMLLSFALGDRINAERRARHEADLEAVRREREAELLSRYMPPQLSQRLRAGDEASGPSPERRDIAALCAVPFGLLESLGRLETAHVAARVNDFVAAMSRLASEHGGVIERFVGPRIGVLFGAVSEEPLADSAAAAAAMADAMQRACSELLAQWDAQGSGELRLRMAIGIAAGTTVVGAFGSETQLEFSALGEPVARAHRLASDAIPGETRVDDRAAALMGERVALTPGPPTEFEPGHASPTFVVAPARPLSVRPQAVGTADTMTVVSAVGLVSTALPGSDAPGTLPYLAPGTLFDGRYRIVCEWGRGGMAVVFRAEHVGQGHERALKLIAPERLRSRLEVEQFRREAEETSRIHHPCAVRVYDFGRSIEGYYYLAMDFVDGESLARRLRRDGAMDIEACLDIAGQVLDALAAAHELGLVHRDVKPANVLLGAGGQVRVSDFGLVQSLQSAREVRPVVVGTPAYMSPEQCRGHVVDARSDLYSFGVTLYEMVSGRRPHQGSTASELWRAIIDEPPAPLEASQLDPEVAAPLWSIIERCLAKQPDARYESAREVARDLARLGAERRERRASG